MVSEKTSYSFLDLNRRDGTVVARIPITIVGEGQDMGVSLNAPTFTREAVRPMEKGIIAGGEYHPNQIMGHFGSLAVQPLYMRLEGVIDDKTQQTVFNRLAGPANEKGDVQTVSLRTLMEKKILNQDKAISGFGAAYAQLHQSLAALEGVSK